jgi:hypothetical protein
MAPLSISKFISFSNTATMYPASFLPISIVLLGELVGIARMQLRWRSLSNTGRSRLLLRQGIGTLVEVLEGKIEVKKGRLCVLQFQACSVSPVHISKWDDADPPR